MRAIVEPHDPDGALFALCARPASPPARGWCATSADFREVRPRDLRRRPRRLGLQESPRVGAILEELLRRKLNGELDGRESEIEAAKALIATPAEHA